MMTVVSILFAVCFLLCWLAVLRFDIQMFQQNSYKPDRYRTWLRDHLFGHWRWTLLLLAALVWNKYLALVAAAAMVLYEFCWNIWMSNLSTASQQSRKHIANTIEITVIISQR